MVAMGRIKSALELALEKIETQQKEAGEGEAFDGEREYIKAAAVLGRSFLQGKSGKEEIREKLQRYPEQSRAAALRAFIAELSLNMNMNNTPLILEAIQFLKKDEQTRDVCAAAAKLYHQYRRRMEENLSSLEETTSRAQQKKLERTGIRGKAIASFNLKGLAAWQETQRQIEEEYSGVMESFRSAVIA
jgi:thioredoxin-like negative regulator of GroEL